MHACSSLLSEIEITVIANILMHMALVQLAIHAYMHAAMKWSRGEVHGSNKASSGNYIYIYLAFAKYNNRNAIYTAHYQNC